MFLGTILLLPSLPFFIAYFQARHLSYGPYGVTYVLLIAYVALLVFYFPFGVPQRRLYYLLSTLVLVLGYWSCAAGFSVFALFFGIGSLLIWRHGTLNPCKGMQSLVTMLLLGWIIIPGMSGDISLWLRKVSMMGVDSILLALGIGFKRVGISYFLGHEQFSVLEKCSGFSAVRVWMIIFSSLYFLRESYFKALFLAPILAIGLGLVCNILRITGHILCTLGIGQSLSSSAHEWLGMGIFVFFLAIVIWRNISRGWKFPERPILTNFQLNPVLLYFVVGLGAVACVASMNPLKRMDHSFREYRTFDLDKVYENQFVEYQGAGGWILLEHPLEQCLAFQGWDSETREIELNRKGKALRLEENYQIGEWTGQNRWKAMAYKWAMPSWWEKPLKVEIRVVESFEHNKI